MLTPPRTGGREKVLVRLSEIDIDLRVTVADRLIRSGRLRGLEAIKLGLAAEHPVQNPAIKVTQEKADRVLLDRKLPLGKTPKYG